MTDATTAAEPIAELKARVERVLAMHVPSSLSDYCRSCGQMRETEALPCVIEDVGELWQLLLDDLNAEGIIPEVSGYDATERPILAWLNESGGDDVWPNGRLLCGEESGSSEPEDIQWEEFTYPLTITLTPMMRAIRNRAASLRAEAGGE